MIGLLLRLYPARWRARYGDEFAALLEERPLGPFDVADAVLGALDAHLHLRGLGAASTHQKGFAMSLRIGGYAAILGGLLWFAGFLVDILDGVDAGWPSMAMILAGSVALLVALVGLSAFQARVHPKLVWAAFALPFAGAVLVIVGLTGVGIEGDSRIVAGVSSWVIWVTGTIAVIVGSGLFAVASWRTQLLPRLGIGALALAASLVAPTMLFVTGLAPWEPIGSALFLVVLVLFAGGWVILGGSALRTTQPRLATPGGFPE